MSWLEALLLGIVQGLTEFLPISSSGHLILVPWAQEYTFLQENADFHKTFDVALHIGTLAGVVIYFREDLWAIAKGFVRTLHPRGREDEHGRLAWAVILATIPAVIVGFFGEDLIDGYLGEPWMIAIQLIVFGILLGIADRLPQRRGTESIGVRDGIIIGTAQALSLAPGTSRSGVTITAARFLGLNRDAAARFSFLLLVPATAGAAVYKGAQTVAEGLPPGVVGPMVVGMLAAGVSGYLAIAGLLAYVRTRSYDVFVVYRVVIGLVILGAIATGLRSATF